MKKEIIYYTSELGKTTFEEALQEETLKQGFVMDEVAHLNNEFTKDRAKVRKQMNKKTKKYKKFS